MAGSVFLLAAVQHCVISFSLPSPRAAPSLAGGPPSAYCTAEDFHAWRRLSVMRRPAHGRRRSKATSLGAWSSFRVLGHAKARDFNLSSPRRRSCVASHFHPRLGVLARWEHTASAIGPIADPHSHPSDRPSIGSGTLLSLRHAQQPVVPQQPQRVGPAMKCVWPNPSFEPTATGKPASAAQLKRYAS